MRNDLLDAQACVDWTQSHLPAFRHRIDAWTTANLKLVVIDTPAPATHDVVAIREYEPIPLAFNVEAGAYLNVLRSSLDILATSLGRRHGVLYPEKWYFPVAESEADFRSGNHSGGKLIEGLPADERLIIEDLKPYRGGHESIWPLHHLDIMRKHRRLITVSAIPSLFGIWGMSRTLLEDFRPVSTGTVRGDQETRIGVLRKGAPDYKMDAAVQITFDEPAFGPVGIATTLERFSAHMSDIIGRFDGP